MTSMQNTRLVEKPSIDEKIKILSQKINGGHIPKQNDIGKKYEAIDQACDDLQNQLQNFRSFADEKILLIKQKTNKISKQLKKDYSSNENSLKEEIANTSQRMMVLVEQQHDLNKESNSRMVKYIEHECKIINELIEKEATEKEKQSRSISESLSADIAEIKMVLDEVTLECKQRLQNKSAHFYQRTDRIANHLRSICSVYSDNESQFYKMLRDLVKKVKNELEDHKVKREQTQSEILNLIDKMCDRTILSKNI